MLINFDNFGMLTWVEINKQAIEHNLREFRRLIDSKIKIMAVVKSNAYGHGMIEVAKIAVKAGANWLGVVNLDEALRLRQAKIKAPIFILSYWTAVKNYSTIRANRRNSEISEIQEAIQKNIDFPIYIFEQAKILSQIAQKIRKKVNIHIKIDTGAGRIGVMPDQAIKFIQEISKLPRLNIQGIFTHYAASEREDQGYTNRQTEILNGILAKLRLLKINIPFVHAACSASTMVNPATHFNMVRLGVALYGLWPSEETRLMIKKRKVKINLKPALIWKTKIIQIKELPAGAFIGYDCTYQTKKKIKIAILPVGYWDGYDRHLSNPTPLKLRGTGCGEVLIRGQRCPIRGRICMNLSMVEVSRLSNVKVGDEVVLIGKQNKKEITADDLAKKIGTINYEVVARINPLIIRKYV